MRSACPQAAAVVTGRSIRPRRREEEEEINAVFEWRVKCQKDQEVILQATGVQGMTVCTPMLSWEMGPMGPAPNFSCLPLPPQRLLQPRWLLLQCHCKLLQILMHVQCRNTYRLLVAIAMATGAGLALPAMEVLVGVVTKRMEMVVERPMQRSLLLIMAITTTEMGMITVLHSIMAMGTEVMGPMEMGLKPWAALFIVRMILMAMEMACIQEMGIPAFSMAPMGGGTG